MVLVVVLVTETRAITESEFKDKLRDSLDSSVDKTGLSPESRSRLEDKELKDQSDLVEYDLDLLPSDFFDSNDDKDQGNGINPKDEKFKAQKEELQYLSGIEPCIGDYISTREYNVKILQDPNKIVNSNIGLWFDQFEGYLESVVDSWVNVPIKFMFDSKSAYGFYDTNIMKKKSTRFGSYYMDERMGKVMKLKDVVEAYKSNDQEYFRTHNYEACEEIKDLLDKPLLFVTITSDRGSPAESFAGYKDGSRYGISGESSFNSFWTALKRKVDSKLGWDFPDYVKGLHPHENDRLHIHIPILGVTPRNDHEVKEFKLILEDTLRSCGFGGYVNDVKLVRDDYTLAFKTDSDLPEYREKLEDKDRSIQKIIETFELAYDKDKTANMNFLKVDPPSGDEVWDKAITYTLKYALNQDGYGDVKDSDKLDNWLEKNVYFWIFNVKRFFISKHLSKLLDKLDLDTDRFYCFDNVYDFLAFVYRYYNALDMDISLGDLYGKIKDQSDIEFDAHALNENKEDDKKVIDRVKDKKDLDQFYKEKFKDKALKELVRSPIVKEIHFSGYTRPSELVGLIRLELFKHLIFQKYRSLGLDPPT